MKLNIGVYAEVMTFKPRHTVGVLTGDKPIARDATLSCNSYHVLFGYDPNKFRAHFDGGRTMPQFGQRLLRYRSCDMPHPSSSFLLPKLAENVADNFSAALLARPQCWHGVLRRHPNAPIMYLIVSTLMLTSRIYQFGFSR